ncbi:MAG: peptidoglycan editing factor PgeF [Pseudomonadota bacterium]
MNPAQWPSEWLLPDWPAPSHVSAVMTSRSGGVSLPPFDAMNLGDHVGDEPAHVASNRLLLERGIAARPVFLKQVHGTQVVLLDESTSDGLQADAAVSNTAGLACMVMVADCLPVLLAHRVARVVGAGHAGWRGLAGGVLESLHAGFCAADADAAATTNLTLAWLGPCIGPRHFEVGAEVRDVFLQEDAGASAFFTAVAQGKFLADLPALARRRLHSLGIDEVYGNDGSDAWCTVSQASRFFSHRRDAGPRGNGFGTTGRMGACVWLT